MTRAAIMLDLLAALAAAPVDASEAPKQPPGKAFVPLAPINAPISRDNRPLGRLTIELSLDVRNQAKADEVRRALPRLQATFLGVVQKYAGSIDSLQTPLQLEAMLADLKKSGDSVLPPGTIDVLVQQALYLR